MSSGGWLCSNCGAFETADGKVYPTLSLPTIEHDFDWQAFRAEAAKDILCAVLSTPGMWTETTYDGLAAACIRQVDELIKQLRK